ncbi:MAG: pyridoxamine 5'-phosphate oxidase family protein [Candidatus Binataceae bacterium]
MVTWDKFAAAAPEMAGFGRGLLERLGAGFLATVRKDGSPRLHPVVPIIAAGRLWVFVNPASGKFHDLRRDQRFALHILIDQKDEEFLVGGRATAMNEDRGLWRVVAAAAPFPIPEDRTESHFLFELAIEYAATTTWYHPGKPDTRPTHKVWLAPR